MPPFFRRARRADETSSGREDVSARTGSGARRPEVTIPRSAAGRSLSIDPAVLVDGRYELVRTIGSGGEARVHLARDRVLERDVALKLFHVRETASDERSRLQQVESRVAAGLNHYALTTLFDAGTTTGQNGTSVYLVMEYVSGRSLAQRLLDGPMEPSEACWLGFDLAEGLDYMHQSGLLHRDVKPANILISGLRSVRPVVAKLTDFGIAAPVGKPDLSEFTVGTAAYLSPEQVEGHDAGPASDVYSLGLVLLEAVTGRRAFPGDIEESAFARLVRDPAIPADVPAALTAILRGMTARRPEDRFDLHRIAVDLQQFLVDDLLRRRGSAGPATVPGMTPQPGNRLDLEGSPALPAVLGLVAQTLGVPHSLVLQQGLDGDARTTRHGAPDARAVARLEALAREPRTTSGTVLVDGPGSARAAIAPLLTRSGSTGLLCALRDDDASFTAAQLRILEGLADLLMADLELRAATRNALFGED